ncbi:hypothetical protein BC829DRAFT_92312 [Chytridium lagenaria]|nr:hypothetical protein BC829DRAFT_92312 [Chytridium lagenaria]
MPTKTVLHRWTQDNLHHRHPHQLQRELRQDVYRNQDFLRPRQGHRHRLMVHRLFSHLTQLRLLVLNL